MVFMEWKRFAALWKRQDGSFERYFIDDKETHLRKIIITIIDEKSVI